jgi:hypothetical protein
VETLDRLLSSLRATCAGLPDKRRGANLSYEMADIGLAAFAVFFMQSPSFLAHQRHLAQGEGRSNCQTLLAMTKIPSDNHVRAMLDPVAPRHFDPVFGTVVAELERTGGLAAFRRPIGPAGDERLLIALDGTEYFRSAKLHCKHCSTRARGKGKREYFHAMLAPAIVAPGHSRVVPLEPEFIVPQDGHDKQDCESQAARRWLAAHGQRYAKLGAVFLGDDLFSRQPICQAVRAAGGHFLFVCKPDSHPTLQEYLTGIDLPEHVERHKRQRIRYRWLCDVPLRDGNRDHQRRRQDHLPQQLRHRPAGRSHHRCRARRLRPRPLEDRERDLQRPQNQGLQPRAQLRPRQSPSRRRARHLEPARLRLPHRLRPRRSPLAPRHGHPRPPHPLLRGAPLPHRLSRLPLLGRPAPNPGFRSRPAAFARLTALSHQPHRKPANPLPTPITQNENCWVAIITLDARSGM